MGKTLGIIAAIVAVIVVILFATGFFKADIDAEGGSLPDVDVQVEGELDAPDIDADLEGPDVSVGEETITVPTIDVDEADEADADAEDDDPNQ